MTPVEERGTFGLSLIYSTKLMPHKNRVDHLVFALYLHGFLIVLDW